MLIKLLVLDLVLPLRFLGRTTSWSEDTPALVNYLAPGSLTTGTTGMPLISLASALVQRVARGFPAGDERGIGSGVHAATAAAVAATALAGGGLGWLEVAGVQVLLRCAQALLLRTRMSLR